MSDGLCDNGDCGAVIDGPETKFFDQEREMLVNLCRECANLAETDPRFKPIEGGSP